MILDNKDYGALPHCILGNITYKSYFKILDLIDEYVSLKEQVRGSVMKVYLACVKDGNTSNDRFEIFSEEKNAVKWIEDNLRMISDIYKHVVKSDIITIKKSPNLNFWQIVNEDEDGQMLISFGHGYIYTKEIK